MMRLFHILLLLLATVVLNGCIKEGTLNNINLGEVVQSAKDAFVEMDDEQKEQLIGEEAVAVLLGAVPLVDNDPLQRYVNQVGHWVALHTERKELDWKFAVIDSEDINAFAAPGGYILVTRGLLLKMNSEAELAGILAHETVHVVRRHYLNAVRKNARVNLLINVAKTQVEADRAKEMEKISNGFKELYARGLDKEDEFEADRMAVVIAARAGYDPYGLPAVLQTLAGMNQKDSSLAFLFKTHPRPSKRLSLLERLFDQLDPYATQPQLKYRFQQQIVALRQ